MCGIVGIAGSAGRPVDDAVLRSMNDALWHRGPDDEGYLVRDQVGLAMRRLSIIDVAGGRQPIHNEDKSVLGRLQRRDLQLRRAARRPPAPRPPLRTRRATPRPSSTCTRSTATPASAGSAGCSRYALWDEPAQARLLARDRFGIKPLYYGRHDGRLYFSSELRAFQRVPGFPARPQRGEHRALPGLPLRAGAGDHLEGRGRAARRPTTWSYEDGKLRNAGTGTWSTGRTGGCRPPSGASGSWPSSGTAWRATW